MSAQRIAAVATLLLLASCRDGRLGEVDRQFRVSPDAVHFAPTWVGDESTAQVTVSNLSRTSMTIGWVPEGGFSTDEHTATLSAGEQRPLTVHFRPSAAGVFTGLITFDTPVGQKAISIDATAALMPSCAASTDCRETHFDRATGQCVTSDTNEGHACESGNLCLSNGRCVQGACLGTPTNCDDGSVCTEDSCSPAVGCLHEASTASCPGTSDPCKAPSCDPVSGCGISNVADGTPCGSVDCAVANICLNGSCLAVTPPEGFECSEASPCQGAGHCANKVCVAPPAMPLTTAFQQTMAYQSFNPSVVDEDGNVYWVEIESSPCPVCVPAADGGPNACPLPECDPVPQAQLVSMTKNGFERYRAKLCRQSSPGSCSEWMLPSTRIMWSGGRIVGVTTSGSVAAVDATNGTVLWTHDVREWVSSVQSLVSVRDVALSASGVLAVNVKRQPAAVATIELVDAGVPRELSVVLLIAVPSGTLSRQISADVLREWQYVAFRANGTLLASASVETPSPRAVERGCALAGDGSQPLPPPESDPKMGTANTCATQSVVSAFNVTGDLLWRTDSCAAAVPLAPIGARVFSRTGWVSASNGQWWAPAQDGGVAVLGDSQITWLASRDLSPAGISNAWPPPATWSLLSGDGMKTLATNNSISSEPLLTTKGDALVVTRDGGLGATNPGAWVVLSTKSDGGIRFRCELPFDHNALEPWLSVGPLMSLKKGVLTLQVNPDCPYCLHAAAPRIEGFNLPGVEISAGGWSGTNGGMHRASREGR